MESDYHDAWKRYGFSEEDAPENIIHEVDLNVSRLVNEYLLNVEITEPLLLVLGGRKAAHLVSRHDRAIDEHGYLRCFIRLFKSDVWSARARTIPKDLPAVILLDSIRTGSESIKLINRLRKNDIKIKKIFCYLLNNKGLKEIIKNDVIEEDKIFYLFSSSSIEEYNNESNKVQVFYRSRIEPMDPDVCFNLYDVNTVLTLDLLKNILTPLKETLSDCTITVNESNDRGFASNIKELLCTIEDCSNIDVLLKKIFIDDFEYSLHGLSIRFKINQKRNSSEFTVITKSQINCMPQKDFDPTKCLLYPERCIEPFHNYPKGSENKVAYIICPNCVDNLISDSILAVLNDFLISEFLKNGITCSLKRKYRPFY